jgi:hypothetical protein
MQKKDDEAGNRRGIIKKMLPKILGKKGNNRLLLRSTETWGDALCKSAGTGGKMLTASFKI